MHETPSIAIVGAGPAALIAAEALAGNGCSVDVYDRMPSPARKFLIAGRGGLNLTHNEPLPEFLARYGAAAEWLAPAIEAFPPEAVRAWCEGLGEPTFVGSSLRVFPRSMKAVGLLRAWLRRLEQLGVRYHPRHHWQGWDGQALRFATPAGEISALHQATLLALGGASWPRLGADGGWVPVLQQAGVAVHSLQPSNCGFVVPWSDYFSQRFAGTPLKPLAMTHAGITQQGEAMLTAQGIEGGLVYAFSAALREAIAREGSARITLDLRPGMDAEMLRNKLASRGNKSLTSFLQSAGFSPVAAALLKETHASMPNGAAELAAQLKALPLVLTGTSGMARAISSAGGVTREACNDDFMLRSKPGVFVAGEMLDWEAPTGGYLLQACFSTGVAAARGILTHLSKHA